MRLAGRNVLPVQMPVDIDGGVDLLHDGVGAAAEASTPHLIAHDALACESMAWHDRANRPVGNGLQVGLNHREKATVIPQPEASLTRRRRGRAVLIVTAAVAGLAAGLLAVYGIGALQRNAGDPACQPAVELARRLAPLARGEVAALAMADAPLRLPDLAFRDAEGSGRHLAEWRGRLLVLNLWATWCIPCRQEMPALDALQGRLGSDRFEVVAINIDTRNPDKPRSWLREVGIERLGYFTDETAKVFQDLKLIGRAIGMPTTLLVDPQGCEIGTIAGPAEWAGPDAVALVSAALRPSAP